MRRPPLVLVFVAVLTIALGATAGAVMSQGRPETARYARARVAANAPAHGLAGSREDGRRVARDRHPDHVRDPSRREVVGVAVGLRDWAGREMRALLETLLHGAHAHEGR